MNGYIGKARLGPKSWSASDRKAENKRLRRIMRDSSINEQAREESLSNPMSEVRSGICSEHPFSNCFGEIDVFFKNRIS